MNGIMSVGPGVGGAGGGMLNTYNKNHFLSKLEEEISTSNNNFNSSSNH
jgi:hypothetical protein